MGASLGTESTFFLSFLENDLFVLFAAVTFVTALHHSSRACAPPPRSSKAGGRNFFAGVGRTDGDKDTDDDRRREDVGWRPALRA